MWHSYTYFAFLNSKCNLNLWFKAKKSVPLQRFVSTFFEERHEVLYLTLKYYSANMFIYNLYTMKKTLLLSAMASLLVANAKADTAYGLMSGWPSWSVCSYDFDQLGAQKAQKMFEVPFTEVQAGAAVGNAYYAFGTISDYETYMDNLYLASINMNTQETVLIKNYGDAWGENGFTMRDLASDGTDLYGIKDNNRWDDATDAMIYSTDVVKINTADGSFEVMGNIAATCWGLTCKEGELYVVKTSGLKGWSYLFDLCKVNADYSLTPVTDNQTETANEVVPSHATTASNGAIYFFVGATPYKMSAEGVTAYEPVTSYQSYAGTTFALSSDNGAAAGGDEEKPVTRMLTTVSSFGDFMGTAKDDEITSQRHYYYNDKLQVVAVITTASDLGSDVLYTQYYSPYVYDENGNLIKEDYYQYGLYDYGDRVMHQAAGVVEYKYDEAGNRVEEIWGESVVKYEYDAEGNCIKAETYASGSLSKTIEYSDFVGKNKPTVVVSTHTNTTFTGEFYEESREYDAEGRLVKAVRLCNRDYVEDHGFWQITTAAGDFMQEEHWTYDGRQLMLYEKFTSIDEETGELQPYLKTVYTVKDENTVGYQSYTAFMGEWYKSGVYQEETYTEFAGMTEVTALQLVSVKKAENAINDALVEFTVPQMANYNLNLAFSIYRNGELARTLSLMDIVSGEEPDVVISDETGNLVFTDRDLKSGTYEYFVQVMTVNGLNDGGIEPLADDVDPGFNVEPLAYVGYCASNILGADFTLELPAATGIKAIASEKDANDLNHVTVQFTLPDAPAELGFISNSLIVGNAQVAEDVTTDPAANQLRCVIGEDTAWVRILTRYAYGKALSEAVLIDVNNLSAPTSIAELSQKLGGEMMIFDMQGRQVNASTENLQGNYIVVSGQKAYKVVIK